MRFSIANLALLRDDRRPLYRRIFTNRRLDILHKVTVRSIFGTILYTTSYIIVKGYLYLAYVRPINQNERELLELELMEADRAGFAVRNILGRLNQRYEFVFFVGFMSGALFELLKIKFSFRGVSFYAVFKRNQLQRELQNYEILLKSYDDILAQSYGTTNNVM